MSILVDTGAWYALADTADRHHKQASGFFSREAARTEFVTTDLIFAETFALLTSHLGRKAGLKFWDTLREARTPILCAEPVDLEAAWRIALAFSDQEFSFVDCTTFALMERQAIQDAFAFDSHFLLYRFGPKKLRAFHRYPA